MEIVQVGEAVNGRGIKRYPLLLQEVPQQAFTLLLVGLGLATEDFCNFGLGTGGSNEVLPLRLDALRLRGQDFHLVSALQAMAQGHQLVVDLGADAVRADVGVQGEGKVQGRGVLRHGLQFTLGREDEYLRSEEVQLDGVQEVDGIGLRVVQDFFDGAEPTLQFAFVLAAAAFLVFPVCGKALFGHIVHALAADLHFYPLAVVAHQGDMQGLVAVALGVADPVAQTVGMRFVYLGDGQIDVEAVVQLLLHVLGFEDDAHGQDVEDFFERHVLSLHFFPDGVDGFDAGEDVVLQPHLVQLGADGGGKLLEDLVTLGGGSGQFALDLGIFLGVFVLEAEVLQFGLNAVQAQAVGQGSIDVEGFARNLVLLVGEHGAQCAHIVQAVGNLDEDDTDVVAHGQQQLFEILGLRRGTVAEDAAGDFGQSVHNLGNLVAEDVFDVLYGIVRILHHVVQQGGADGGRAQSDFIAHNFCHGDGVHDVWLARTSLDALVGVVGKVERLGDNLHALTVLGGQIVVQQLLKRLLYHDFFGLFLLFQTQMLFHSYTLYVQSSTPPCPILGGVFCKNKHNFIRSKRLGEILFHYFC